MNEEGQLTRRDFLLLLAAAGSAALVGCGGGGSGGQATDLSALGRGGVGGYLYRSPGGELGFGYSATPPAGATAVSGATVRVANIPGVAPSAVTAADGAFAIADVPTGLWRLRASASGKVVETPLTVLEGAAVQVGDPPVTRQQAINAAKAEAAKTLDLATADVLAMQQPLPAGVSLVAGLQNVVEGQDPGTVYQPAGPQWLIYLDQAPGSRWGHDATFVLVDAQTGAVTVMPAGSWPTVNGCCYYAVADVNSTSPDLVQAATRAPAPPRGLAAEPAPVIARPPTRGRDHVPDCTDPKTYAVVVQGDDDTDFAADPPKVPGLFGTRALPPAESIVNIRTTGMADPRQAIIDAWNAQCARADYCDYVVFYLTTHGALTHLGNQTVAYHATLQLYPGQYGDGRRSKLARLRPADLAFAAGKACHVVIITDTCYSGWWTRLLDTGPLADATGKEVVVLTAANENQPAMGYRHASDVFDPSVGANVVYPTGGLFTQAILNEFKKGFASDALYQDCIDAYTKASALVDRNSRQRPMLRYRLLAADEVCGCGSATGTIQ